MLWDSTRVSVQILQAHHQFIHTRMQLAEGQTSLFTAVYASPMRHERRQLWKELNNIAKSNQEPWVLVGDWNMILDASEKKGGAPPDLQKCREFREVLSNCKLLDLGFQGNKFTWKRGSLYQRLDRVLCNFEWQTDFMDASVKHLPRIKSDHSPLLLRWNKIITNVDNF